MPDLSVTYHQLSHKSTIIWLVVVDPNFKQTNLNGNKEIGALKTYMCKVIMR